MPKNNPPRGGAAPARSAILLTPRQRVLAVTAAAWRLGSVRARRAGLAVLRHNQSLFRL